MLGNALAVVQAVRGLNPYANSIGLWNFKVEPRHLLAAIRDVGESLQAFDRATGRGDDPTSQLISLLRSPGSGIDVDRLIAELAGEAPSVDSDAVPDYIPKPGEVGPPDKDDRTADGLAHGEEGSPLHRKLADKFTPDHGLDAKKRLTPAVRPSDTPRPDVSGLKPKEQMEITTRASMTASSSTSCIQMIQGRMRSILSRSDIQENPRIGEVFALWRTVKSGLADNMAPGGAYIRMTPATLNAMYEVIVKLDDVDHELLHPKDTEFAPPSPPMR